MVNMTNHVYCCVHVNKEQIQALYQRVSIDTCWYIYSFEYSDVLCSEFIHHFGCILFWSPHDGSRGARNNIQLICAFTLNKHYPRFPLSALTTSSFVNYQENVYWSNSIHDQIAHAPAYNHALRHQLANVPQQHKIAVVCGSVSFFSFSNNNFSPSGYR